MVWGKWSLNLVKVQMGGGGKILTIFSELTQKSNKMCVQETLDTKKKEAREELQHWEDYLKKVSFATGCFMPSQQWRSLGGKIA